MRRLVLALAVLAAGCVAHRVAAMFEHGGLRTLRDRPRGTPPSAPGGPPILLLAVDGVDRDLLYGLLRDGQMPHLAELLGGDGLAHAYLDDHVLSTFPSMTVAAWTSAITGKTPAEDGVPGNEWFERESRTLACPAPISFHDLGPTLDIYNEGYLDRMIDGPTVYERIHAREPDALIWVGLMHVARGADALLIAKRTVIADAAGALVDKVASAGAPTRDAFAALDNSLVDLTASQLDHGPAPDVLTIYLPGTDSWAHVSELGPDRARREYLTEIVDPAIGRLTAALRAHGALARRWIVVTADHGHTEVVHDDAHTIPTAATARVLERAGFRVRPFQRDVDARDPFSAVVAYGGATAYVYLADRSRCPAPRDVCPWQDPPRYREDVLAAADAFYSNDHTGALAPELRGALDLVLVRRPRPYREVDLPFEVYVGHGRTMPVEAYLQAHPHPSYVDFPARLRALAVGVHGERAGDVLLIPHFGDRDAPADRRYFAGRYHSFHGSASRRDSEIPLIVARPGVDGAALGAWVDRVVGPHPTIAKVADLIYALRVEPPHAELPARGGN